MKIAIILEEILYVFFNGYNSNHSILSKGFADEFFYNILQLENENFIETVKLTDIRLQLKSIGCDFKDKEIDTFIYCILIIVEKFNLSKTETSDEENSTEQSKDKEKELLKVFKKIVKDVLLIQFFTDLLMYFESSPDSMLHDWTERYIEAEFMFKIKQRQLMKNDTDDFIDVIQMNVQTDSGEFEFPRFFVGDHTIRLRERNNKIKITLTEWITNLVNFFNDPSNDQCIISSRKMFLLLQAFIQYYNININMYTLLEKILNKYNIEQLPEIGINTNTGKKQFVTRIHTSYKNTSGNYFMWIRIKNQKDMTDDKLSNLNIFIQKKNSEICDQYLSCIQNLPETVQTYIPSLTQQSKDLFTYLEYEKKFKFTNLFVKSISFNRSLYIKYKKMIDAYLSSWSEGSKFTNSKKILFLRYLTHSFGIIVYYPQSFLTKKLRKEDFIKEFPFFAVDGTKSISCDETKLIETIKK